MKIMFYYSTFENLGIEYLSAVLKKAGHQTRLLFDPGLFNDPFINIKILNKFFNFEQYLINQAIEYDPDIFVFSATSSTYLSALEMTRKIKKIFKKKIIFGGIHATSVPEEVILEESIDYVIVGEGENALLELVDCLQSGKTIKNIKNLCFKEDGNIIKNPVRPLIENLDSMPFPDKDLFYNVMPELKTGYTVITRRGCPNICSYCHNTVLRKIYVKDKKVRIRSVDNVIEELRDALKKYNFKRLRINDDLFTSDAGWLEDFSEQYEKFINRPVFCFVNPAHIDEKIVRSLKRICCYQVCMGVQSIKQDVREKILKRYHTNEQIKDAINLFRKFKIRCVVDNIIGLPNEKESDLLDMLSFYNKNRPDRVCVFWLIYFPLTDIVDIGLQLGAIDIKYVQAMMQEPESLANTMHNKIHAKDKKCFHVLLVLLKFFSPRVIDFIIERKFFRFFSCISPALIEIPLSMIARDRLDIVRRRYYLRYAKFGSKVLIKKLKIFLKINNNDYY